MPIDYKRYPPDWNEIRAKIMRRAQERCEECGRKNYNIHGVRTGNRPIEWVFTTHSTAREALPILTNGFEWDKKPVIIVLTIHHMDEDPENWDVQPNRLVALCQRCHLAKHPRNSKAKTAPGQ